MKTEEQKVQEISAMFASAEEAEQEEQEIEQDNSDDSEVSQDVSEDDQEDTKSQSEEEAPTWWDTLGVKQDDIVLDDDGNLTGMRISINGKKETVDFKTLRDGFQFTEYARRQTEDLSKERNAFEESRTQATQYFEKKLGEVQQVNKMLNDMLISEYNGINWAELKQSDPELFADKYFDFQNRQAKLAQVRQAVEEEYSNFQKEQADKWKAFQAEQSQKAVRTLVANHPEWVDTNKMKQDFQGYQALAAKEYGITQEEFQSIIDPRHIEILRDAYLYRQGKKAGQEKLEKNVVSFAKQGKTSKPQSKLEQLTKAAKNSTGRQKIQAQEAAVLELLTKGIK